MDITEYQAHAAGTAIYPRHHAVVYPALGLAGETGEVAEKIKKWLRDGTIDRDAIKAELGDVLWYLAALSNDLGFTLDEVARANLDKLASRKARNRLQGSGDDR